MLKLIITLTLLTTTNAALVVNAQQADSGSPQVTPTPAVSSTYVPKTRADLIAEVVAARRAKVAAMRQSCRDREQYLQIYEIAPDRDREMLRELCASSTRRTKRR